MMLQQAGPPNAPGQPVEPEKPAWQTGTFISAKDKFGFIRQNGGGADLFVMNGACIGFGQQLPAIGMEVMFMLGLNPKTGKDMAQQVMPLRPSAGLSPGDREQLTSFCEGQQMSFGTFVSNRGKYGFIKVVEGADLFVMPHHCVGFGGCLPPVGAELVYQLGTNPKTGKETAVQVQLMIAPIFSLGLNPATAPAGALLNITGVLVVAI